MPETIASYQVPEHHVKMYTANVQAALNKKGGLLTPFVTAGGYVGERVQVVNFLGQIEFSDVTSVYADTDVSQIEHTQRWLTGTQRAAAVYVDRLDVLKMIYDPTSPYVERIREAAARRMDEIIMASFFADAKAGKDGNTTITFPAGDVIAHGSTRMTVAKLRAARKMLKQRHVDLRTEQPYIAVTAEQVDDLLTETQVGSSDYNAVKPLVDGEVSRFMGFTFIPYEDNGVSTDGKGIPEGNDGAAYRRCPVWVMSGMHHGMWDGLTIQIDRLPTKNNTQQIYASFYNGATRVEEGKVLELRVLE